MVAVRKSLSFISWNLTRAWASVFLLLLGIFAGIAGLLDALFPDIFEAQGWAYLTFIFGISALGSSVRVWPRSTYQKHFPVPGTTVTLVVGDLFEQEGHLVIGMNDIFDTEIPAIIKPGSIQGQLLLREYQNDLVRLNKDLEKALQGMPVLTIEPRQGKPVGKRRRYEMGTVAVIGDSGRRYFCSAYARMDNSGVVQASVEGLWLSLSKLWIVVRDVAQQDIVSIPVVGSGLARISGRLSHVDLVRLIILSFLAASRERIVTKELRIILYPADLTDVEFRSITDVLRGH
ncbi:macro domain-containing protein [Streptosporangium sp. NPDC005286]|uniref:macro domain-containing protein n=1 Tax=Streptosporangium sp. NPDC005286 TaxID=3154463 RepID=UPI0033AB335F